MPARPSTPCTPGREWEVSTGLIGNHLVILTETRGRPRHQQQAKQPVIPPITAEAEIVATSAASATAINGPTGRRQAMAIPPGRVRRIKPGQHQLHHRRAGIPARRAAADGGDPASTMVKQRQRHRDQGGPDEARPDQAMADRGAIPRRRGRQRRRLRRFARCRRGPDRRPAASPRRTGSQSRRTECTQSSTAPEPAAAVANACHVPAENGQGQQAETGSAGQGRGEGRARPPATTPGRTGGAKCGLTQSAPNSTPATRGRR